MTRTTKPFWQIEMTSENYLKVHQCYDAPDSGIDVIFDCCKIDIIPLYNLSDKNFLGRFGDNGKEKFIAYNADLSPERILFTKAHELGHFALHHNLKSDIITEEAHEKSEQKDPQETEANVFAAAFLMPKKLVIETVNACLPAARSPFYKDNNITYDDLFKAEKECVILAIKQKFHTSKESIEWRVKNISQS